MYNLYIFLRLLTPSLTLSEEDVFEDMPDGNSTEDELGTIYILMGSVTVLFAISLLLGKIWMVFTLRITIRNLDNDIKDSLNNILKNII